MHAAKHRSDEESRPEMSNFFSGDSVYWGNFFSMLLWENFAVLTITYK